MCARSILVKSLTFFWESFGEEKRLYFFLLCWQLCRGHLRKKSFQKLKEKKIFWKKKNKKRLERKDWTEVLCTHSNMLRRVYWVREKNFRLASSFFLRKRFKIGEKKVCSKQNLKKKLWVKMLSKILHKNCNSFTDVRYKYK